MLLVPLDQGTQRNKGRKGISLGSSKGMFDWQFQTYQILKTVNFAETETISQSNKKFFKTAGFRFILTKTRFPVEKHDYESGPWQQRLELPITVSSATKFASFSEFRK